MNTQDPQTTVAVDLPEPPDGTLYYWPETETDWPLVLIRDDAAAVALDYEEDECWFRPGEQDAPATWEDVLGWIRDEFDDDRTPAELLAAATVVHLSSSGPVAGVGDFTLDDDSLARLAWHAGVLSQPLLTGDQSTPYELTAEDAASVLAVLAMVPQLATALRNERADNTRLEAGLEAALQELIFKTSEAELLGQAVDKLRALVGGTPTAERPQ